ncbi:uncharacterized protein LOC105421445 [Amborella trichopoda]|uniref:uncharacterized protein LOC105421445 n=1 Tax=Amborella trichopoda TaxID=13333 RepID=UPI0005D45B77|nr:uncharacterized protein LOC105421445 [Amborella trichopoda]|eukprot:XP_011627183.1 uncharacterized protein LOC105421445 [Amborella trichopoda]
MGIKVNFHKSSLVTINCGGNVAVNLARVVGCKIASFPIFYLGLPISGTKFPIAVWDKVIERVQIKLDLWKHKYLSLGGRVTLLRSCLANLPVYQMSLIQMPASMGRKLEKMMRDFLWGSNDDHRKFHLVRWDKVCTPKREGGLDIQNVRKFNEVLLCKWWWRSIISKDQLRDLALAFQIGWDLFGYAAEGFRDNYSIMNVTTILTVTFSYVYKEANEVADALGKGGVGLLAVGKTCELDHLRFEVEESTTQGRRCTDWMSNKLSLKIGDNASGTRNGYGEDESDSDTM